jgi:hypothetical protein
MFNPGMFGISPEQMQAAKQVGQVLKVEIRKCPREGRIEIRYVRLHPEDQESQKAAAAIVDSFAGQMAYLHDTLFAMKGNLIHLD